MANWLKNKTIILTGASDGIGKELTKILIQKYNTKVIGIGRNQEKMLRLKEELGELAPFFTYRLFDVSQKSAWEYFEAELHSLGVPPTLLINNAGIFPPLTLGTEIPSQTVEKVLQTNFLSSVYAIEAFSLERPAIVNISSSAALCSVVGSSAYGASKCALKGYTVALQLEWGKKRYIGIMYPGTTATGLFRDDNNVQKSAMTKIAASPQKMAKKIARKIYKKRKRAILGWDAKLMNFFAKIMPVKGPAFIAWVMKKSKSKAFENIYPKD